MKSYLTKKKILKYKNVANVTDLNSLTSVIKRRLGAFSKNENIDSGRGRISTNLIFFSLN